MARESFTRRGIEFKSQGAYRRFLAHERGYDSRAAERKDRQILVAYDRLTRGQRRAQGRALEVLNDVRNGTNIGAALARRHTSKATVEKYAPGALGQKADTLPVVMRWLGPSGPERVVTRSSEDRRLIGQHASDLWKVQRGKMTLAEFETKWKDVSIDARGQQFKFVADSRTLRFLDRSGEISGFSPYPHR